jgi:DNA-directed RNA polymerase subunit RPC12/RpoP
MMKKKGEDSLKMERKMEEITCPECGSSEIEEKKRKVAVGSGRGPHGQGYPPEEYFYYYECLNCGHEFDESDLVEGE